MSQLRAAELARLSADQGIQQQQQQDGNDGDRIIQEPVLVPIIQLSNRSSPPVTRSTKLRVESVTEPVASTAGQAAKRKQDVSSGQTHSSLAINRNTPVRQHVDSMIEAVRPHLRQLQEDTDDVSMWINLLQPKLDNGNNFGVEVQDTAMDSVSKAGVRYSMLLDGQCKSYQFACSKITHNKYACENFSYKTHFII